MITPSTGLPRQLSLYDFWGAAPGADPDRAVPPSKPEDGAAQPLASRPPSDLPPIRDDGTGAGERLTCAAAAAPPASEGRSCPPASLPGSRAVDGPADAVDPPAAQDRAPDAPPAVPPSASSPDEAPAGLSPQAGGGRDGPAPARDADGEPRARTTDPTRRRDDDIEALGEGARRANRLGGPAGAGEGGDGDRPTIAETAMPPTSPSTGRVGRGPTDGRKVAAQNAKGTTERYKPDFTYRGLLEFCKGKPNRERNCAAIRGLMRHYHRGPADDAVADIQSVGIVNAYLDAAGRNPNRIGALSYLRVIVTEPAKRGFKEAVRWSVILETERGGTIAGLANAIGLGRHTVWKYANLDDRPSKNSREALQRLEMLSGYPPGTLTQHIPTWSAHYFIPSGPYFDLNNPHYNFFNKGTSVSPLPTSLVEQTQAFFEYKSCEYESPSFLLPDGSRKELYRETAWTRNSKPARMPSAFERWNDFPSAPIALAAISKFCSFVDPVTGTSADSLAFAFDPKLVEKVLRRDMKIAKGYNHGHENLIGFVAQLLHPTHGFLVQLPEVFLPEVQRRGIDMKGLPWDEFVTMRHSEIKNLPRKLVPGKSREARANRSRDKKKKLQEFLSHPDTYGELVFPTLQRLRDEEPPSYAPEGVKLDFEIKYLTLILFSACPLRLLNWAFAKWGTNLRKRQGKWWVHIPLEKLKNRRFIKEDFDFLLPDYASNAVDHYFENVRARMAARNPDAEELVLAGPHLYKGRARRKDRSGRDISSAGDRVYRNIEYRMKTLTKQLWNVSVTPHDWRDIYATDYLHKFPGEVLTVAAVLNDSIRTVLREYAQPDTTRLSRHAATALDAAWSAAESRRK